MNAGDKMLVHVVGGCGQFVPKRDLYHMHTYQRRTAIQISGSNATLSDPNGDGSVTYITSSLGELQDGHYDIQTDFDGQVDNVTILDNDGVVYAKCDIPISHKCSVC
jgi:hypothetical protein